MFIYIVEINVKPEFIEEFKAETVLNARNTTQEPKNIRFDVLQQSDDPTKFTLFEVYSDKEGLESHRKTDHYYRWKNTVEVWMASPRKATSYVDLFFKK